MSSTVIAVLTYRRQSAIETFLRSLAQHCPGVPVAVFEDCANFDDTRGFLTDGAEFKGNDAELEAEVWERPGVTVFMGHRNVGVASSSNKAIKWFERQKGATHLLLCNDDIEALGNFPAEYAKAHVDLKIGLFCFTDPVLGEEYVGPQVKVLGHNVRLVPRMTGVVMSMTRELVDRIGYYDVSFGRMGEEHCDFNNRARLAGFINLRGKPQQCLDLATSNLRNQVIRPSVSGSERSALDRYASEAMHYAAARYQTESWYRPYRLLHPPRCGSYGGTGIPVRLLEAVGYRLIVDYNFHDSGSTQ